jgi:hypothetical protein
MAILLFTVFPLGLDLSLDGPVKAHAQPLRTLSWFIIAIVQPDMK